MTGPVIVELGDVGSTNDIAEEQAAAGAADGTWLRADRQNAGRGRRGRIWLSDAGNVFTTTICRPQPSEGPPQQLSFVAAVALDQALQRWVPAERLGLKWPNDVLLDGVKCSGILLEAVPGATLIGIGVNLVHYPLGTERPATSLAASGFHVPAAAAFVAVLADIFAEVRSDWRARGFLPIRAAWLTRATSIGQPIVARLGAETLFGLFAGLADDGALQLQLDNGEIRPVHAGEVFALEGADAERRGEMS